MIIIDIQADSFGAVIIGNKCYCLLFREKIHPIVSACNSYGAIYTHEYLIELLLSHRATH